MKKNDAQELLFIFFVFTAAIAIFTENGFFDVSAFFSGIAFGTLMTVDFLK